MSAPLRKSVGRQQPSTRSEFWQAEVAGGVTSSAARSVTAPRARPQETAEPMSRPAPPDERSQGLHPASGPDEELFDPNSWEAGPTEEALTTLAVGTLPAAKVPDVSDLGELPVSSGEPPSPAEPPKEQRPGRRSQNPARALLGGAAPGQPAVRVAQAEDHPAGDERPVPPPLPRRQKPVAKRARPAESPTPRSPSVHPEGPAQSSEPVPQLCVQPHREQKRRLPGVR